MTKRMGERRSIPTPGPALSGGKKGQDMEGCGRERGGPEREAREKRVENRKRDLKATNGIERRIGVTMDECTSKVP